MILKRERLFSSGNAATFLVDNVGEDGVFLFSRDLVVFPVVGELIAGLRAHQPLLDPLFAPPVLPPEFTGAVERADGVAHVLNALVPYLGDPELDGMGLRAGDGLD